MHWLLRIAEKPGCALHTTSMEAAPCPALATPHASISFKTRALHLIAR